MCVRVRKQYLALDYLPRLICHKPNQLKHTKQSTNNLINTPNIIERVQRYNIDNFSDSVKSLIYI